MIQILSHILLLQQTVYVPDDYPTIQSAIQASIPGDTVIVRDGRYYEQIDFLGKDLLVESENGSSNCVLEVDALNTPVASFTSGETSAATLSGFRLESIVSADDPRGGNVVFINQSSPLIRDLVLVGFNPPDNNLMYSPGDWPGSGFKVQGGAPTLSGVEVRNSSFGNRTVSIEDADVVIADSVFYSNLPKIYGQERICLDGGGSVDVKRSSVDFLSCNFINSWTCNQDGSALFAEDASILIQDCHFSRSGVLGNTNGVRGGTVCIERTTLFIERTEFHDSWIGPTLYSEGGIGGCLFAQDSVLEMADTLVSNSASQDGGAIACIGGELHLTRVELTENEVGDRRHHVSGRGLAILLDGTNAVAVDSILAGNVNISSDPGGGSCLEGGSSIVFGSRITGSAGGIASAASGNHVLIGCLIDNNASDAGIYGYKPAILSVTALLNCTIALNQTDPAVNTPVMFRADLCQGSAFWGNDGVTATDLKFDEADYCYFDSPFLPAWSGSGSLALGFVGDAGFVDPGNGDFSLLPWSPLINAGDPKLPADSDGTRADIGAIPYVHSTLSGIVGWGSDEFSQLSDAPEFGDFNALSAGYFHNLALSSSGRLVSWGNDDLAQVSGTPTGAGFVAIEAGGFASYALRQSGRIFAWGNDGYSQVSGTPTGHDFIGLGAGPFTAHAIRTDGSLVSWGRDTNGQVSRTPTGQGFVAVDAGQFHSLALRSDRSLVSWGDDWSGQVSGTPSSADFQAIAAGYEHSIGLRTDGSLVSWGSDSYGQVSGTPTGFDFIAVAAGRFHSTALRANGQVVAWGDDTDGQVSGQPSLGPVRLISAGRAHSIAVEY